MKPKELMMKSLTNLLQTDETLLYPIYGILNQGNEQYYGYFGLTENNLIIALISASGRRITNTIRIPLDVKSVKVKKNFIGQYIIDINFKEGSPCKITANPKVLFLDSQKENLPLFIDFLKNKAETKENLKLKDIEGKKIRWQYFTPPLILLAFCIIFFPYCLLIVSALDGKFEFLEWISDLWISIKICGILSIPFILLYFLNSHFFGKIVCVINDKGIYYENGFKPWREIEKVEYEIDFSGGNRIRYCHAVLHTKKGKIPVMHAPLHILSTIKKFKPDLTAKVSKNSEELLVIIFVAFFILVPIIGLLKIS